MSVLVTGGAGFVGGHVVRILARSGGPVVVFDGIGPDDVLLRFLGEAAARVAFVRGDVRDRAAVADALRRHGVDRLLHAAAITANTIEAERARFAETVDVNVMGTLAVLEAARGHPLGRIVHVSSSSIYGPTDPGRPVAETAPANPVGLYATTKWAGEQLARRYAEVHGLPLVAVRLTVPFGPLERDQGSRARLSPFPGWARAAAAGEELVVSDLGAAYDYTYAEDVARGIAAALEAPRLSHNVYNVSNGVACTVGEALGALGEHFPGLRYRVAPEAAAADPSRHLRPQRGPLDPARLFTDCGYRPSYDLKAGVAAYVAWLRAEGLPPSGASPS